MAATHVLDLDALELMLADGRTGSLTRAGAERGVGQAAVSRRLRTVERLVGARLVERGPVASRLTTAGSLLPDWSADVLRAAERLDPGIAFLHTTQGTRLRVALPDDRRALPVWLQALRAGSPDITVASTAVNSPAVGGPTPLPEAASTSAARAAAVAGVGPAVLSSLTAGEDLATRRPVEVPVEALDLRRELRAVRLRGTNPEEPPVTSRVQRASTRPGLGGGGASAR